MQFAVATSRRVVLTVVLMWHRHEQLFLNVSFCDSIRRIVWRVVQRVAQRTLVVVLNVS